MSELIFSQAHQLHLEHIPNTEYERSSTGTSFCFHSLVTFITLLPYDQGDETRDAPNFRCCTHEGKEKEKLHATMTKSLVFSCDCWWFVHFGTCPAPRLCRALADCGSAFPPPLLLQELDAIVDVELDCSPVSLVAH